MKRKAGKRTRREPCTKEVAANLQRPSEEILRVFFLYNNGGVTHPAYIKRGRTLEEIENRNFSKIIKKNFGS